MAAEGRLEAEDTLEVRDTKCQKGTGKGWQRVLCHLTSDDSEAGKEESAGTG